MTLKDLRAKYQSGATSFTREDVAPLLDKKHKVHHSSSKDDWTTPSWLFELLNKKFDFQCDLFADANNALCPKYLSDCFTQPWDYDGYAFGNPPYRRSKPTTWDFVRVTHEQYIMNGKKSVLLLPARTDTQGWHAYCMDRQKIYIRGRLNFGGCKDGAPFPSVLVVFDEGDRLFPSIDATERCWV